MREKQIFESSVRSAGDLAGVFEDDGETAYFYLFDQTRPSGEMVVDAIHVASGAPGFGKDDIRVEWDPTETRVGLLIRGQLWAAFDSVARVRYGGDYNPNGQPEIPTKIMQSFW